MRQWDMAGPCNEGKGSALAQGLDAVVGGVDAPRLLLGLLLQLGAAPPSLSGWYCEISLR